MSYNWPGNIRELKSALDYAFVIAEQGLIEPDHLPPKIAGTEEASEAEPFLPDRGQAEKEALIEALRHSRGNQSEAARILGVNRVTVWNRMRKYGIDLKKIMSF